MVDPLSTRDLIKRLGTFLADLTMDRPPARIHADITDRLRETWQQPDPQLSGVYFDDKDFSSVWMAIRNGASLPINSWDTVVLPAIAFYSSREAFKPNMETAIHLWGQARSSLSNVLEGPSSPAIVPVYEVVDEQAPDTLAALFSSAGTAPERAVPPPRRSGGKRWLVAGFASLLIVLAAVAVVLYGNASKEPFAGTLPRNVTTGNPTEEPITDPSSFLTPSPGASATLEPSAPPTQTPSMPAGVVAPTAPRAAAVAGKTHTTVTLSWQPPVNAGTGGLSHYRISKGMTEIGSTMATSFTISFLLPKTTYAFNVTAVNRGGASSPSSNVVSVTTDPPPVARPSATVKTNPGPFISYGMSFSVIGDDWPCAAPAQVDIYLRNELIASPTTDDKGHFEVQIVIIFDLPNAMIPITNRQDEYLILQNGVEETIKAVLTSHMQCSSTELKQTQVTFG